MPNIIPHAFVTIGLLIGASLIPASAQELLVDCTKPIGRIRPLHGVNNGPLQGGELVNTSDCFKAISVPYTRLHDCNWPNPDVVDIHAIFRNPAADPADPASYDFRRTDDFLKALAATGSKVVYRLGESIEHTKRKYHVNPPTDPDRWAAACLGVIRHYNEGWADGFHYNIRYWEIWNEPENRPQMWTGSDDDFLRLYEAATRTIKAKFPDLKVGGPGFGYSGKFVNGRFEPSELLLKLLGHCRRKSLSLDFLSWHLYTNDPAECIARARALRTLLNEQGFSSSELHFNEWNYLPDNDWGPLGKPTQARATEEYFSKVSGPAGAAFAACVLVNLQDSPVDVANFYSADTQGFGMFSTYGVPHKTFYAFKAFRMLLDTPLRLETHGSQPSRIVVCAGTNADKSEVRIVVSNFNSADPGVKLTVQGLPWKGPTLCRGWVVDAERELVAGKEIELSGESPIITQELKAPAVSLVSLTPRGR
ncbi:MAG: hypothetical protein ABSH20_08700 [Tepidisphaeraceae bacterium]|jgi:hypothetical protein